MDETCQTKGYDVGTLCSPTTCQLDQNLCANLPDPNRPTLAAGVFYTCALLNTGAVRCWGVGSRGQLGYGNTENIGDDETPASAGDIQLGGTALAITAGHNHACALLSKGAVRCWGEGASGQLGYGNTIAIGDDETPASAGDVPVGSPAVAITAGGAHTCALLNTGAVRCWGAATVGQLGYGNKFAVGDDETPASAGDVPVGSLAVAITAGTAHTCALLSSGAVRCWGRGDFGKLGYGNENFIGDDETPDSAGDVPLGSPAVAITAGRDHTCALLDTGAVRCWGLGGSGQLGYGNTDDIGDNETPESAGDVPLGSPAVAITAGMDHTCALLTTGAVRCWGEGASGRLGYGNFDNIGNNETPASAGDVDVGGTAVAITAGLNHTCALLSTGVVRCWGRGLQGQLGYGNTNTIGDNETPASAGDVPFR